jgi:DNA-directed RNA polymerase specialized sigma24 family protein
MSSTKITKLDRRLYAWLVQSNERRFELAFNAYFSVAFPAVVGHLMRISRWDANQLEELAQETLLKFFERVGRKRRVSFEVVDQALSHIRPLNCGDFHIRHVANWSKDITSFRDRSIGFQLGESDELLDSDWKDAIHSLSEQIPVLQRQGYQIVYTVRVDLCWDMHEVDNQSGTTSASIQAFAKSLAVEAKANSERARVADQKHPGLAQFVYSASTIIDNLPRLRVPTNGFLFEIATNVYLDECKKRTRKKRGGNASNTFVPTATTDRSTAVGPHPIDMLNPNLDNTADGDEHAVGMDDHSARESEHMQVMASIDPTLQYENEDLFEKFYEYLRMPLTEAIEAYQAAALGKNGNAERKKVEMLTAKFERLTAVLSLMGEGNTQEQTAGQLDLSRNQVKYIMESVQQAYQRFTSPSARMSTQSTTSREDSNADKF